MTARPLPKRSEIHALSNDALDARLRTLVGAERHIELEFVLHLAEFDTRRQYERKGFRSLWDYCTRSLGLLEGATRRRIVVARVIREFPEAIAYLRDAKVWVTTLAMLEKHLTHEKAIELLEEASGKSVRDVEKLVAKLSAPVVEVESVTFIEPAVVPVTAEEATLLRTSPIPATPENVATGDPSPAPAPTNLASLFAVVSPEVRDRVRAVSPEQYDFHFTGDRELYDLYIELKDRTPNHGVANLMKRGLQALKNQIGKKNGTIPVRERSSPKKPDDPPSPRAYVLRKEGDHERARKAHIPISMWREVFARDEGRCTYTLLNGDRCNSERFCEPDHILPEARGGRTAPENLRVVCHDHNQRLADVIFGKSFMDKRRKST